MSVRVSSRVWAESKLCGPELLMLLAIADRADDSGKAYPSVATLATKCRIGHRQAIRILMRLRESNELEITDNAGPGGTNLYRITQPPPLTPVSPLPPDTYVTANADVTPDTFVTLTSTSPLTSQVATPDILGKKPLTPVSPNTSLIHQETLIPSLPRLDDQTQFPNCPQQKLIALFVERVKDLPRPKAELWEGKNSEAMRARWRWAMLAEREDGTRYATNEAEAIEWFGKFFDHVAASDFLTGRDGKWQRCSLGWLMNRENFAKVVNNHYVNRAVA